MSEIKIMRVAFSVSTESVIWDGSPLIRELESEEVYMLDEWIKKITDLPNEKESEEIISSLRRIHGSFDDYSDSIWISCPDEDSDFSHLELSLYKNNGWWRMGGTVDSEQDDYSPFKRTEQDYDSMLIHFLHSLTGNTPGPYR